ncbi:MAG: hypothetical protein IT503_13925, partial [Burkholderiaceae bacterium]|nr:hypothetical protein [Burkholderiaceae bacterium]
SDLTAFHGFSTTPLANGQYVALRAVYRGLGDGFLATRVILDDMPPASPTGGPVLRSIGIAHGITATSLKVGLVQMAIVSGATEPLGSDVVNGTVVRAWFYRDVPNARWVALRVRPAPLF